MKTITRFLLVLPLLFSIPLSATIIEMGDLNIIDDPFNTSDGLRFLDMTYGDGLSLTAALSNAQATYANARLATSAEWDNLFIAASIGYVGALTAADAFNAGSNIRITSSDSDVGVLAAQLGYTISSSTWMWSDPDGSSLVSSTREYLLMGSSFVDIRQDSRTPSQSFVGWLIVSDANVPTPTTLALFGLGLAGLGWSRRKKS